MKIQQISEIQPTLPMTEHDFMAKYRESFACSELGRILTLLPLSEMAASLSSRFPKRNPRGRKTMFPPEGEIALMFLKSYTGLSDEGLIEMLNGSVHMQMFCGVLLDPSNPIKDGKIVSAIRNRMAGKLEIKSLQKHYGLGRIPARNQQSETLMLFFGIHMANAAILAARQLATEHLKKKSAA